MFSQSYMGVNFGSWCTLNLIWESTLRVDVLSILYGSQLWGWCTPNLIWESTLRVDVLSILYGSQLWELIYSQSYMGVNFESWYALNLIWESTDIIWYIRRKTCHRWISMLFHPLKISCSLLVVWWQPSRFFHNLMWGSGRDITKRRTSASCGHLLADSCPNLTI